METRLLTPQRLSQSVIAVPPLARDSHGFPVREENRKMIEHLQRGGVNLLLYGGNALFYHLPLSQFAATLEMLQSLPGEGTAVVPSVGPAYGLMMDQATVLRDFAFPTAMVLPQREVADELGIARGIRAFADRFGRPIVLYLKFPHWLSAPLIEAMVRDGLISWIKYAVVVEDPGDDDELRVLADTLGTSQIISGIGEQPAIIHLRDFRLQGYTSGCVCVAPHRSMAMLRAIQAGAWDEAESLRACFHPLEDLRNRIHPIRVLHRAVELAGIATTGPLPPLLSDVPAESVPAIAAAARELLASEALLSCTTGPDHAHS